MLFVYFGGTLLSTIYLATNQLTKHPTNQIASQSVRLVWCVRLVTTVIARCHRTGIPLSLVIQPDRTQQDLQEERLQLAKIKEQMDMEDMLLTA